MKENQLVLEELKHASSSPGCIVYKSVGDVLTVQDTGLALENVSKRIEFISAELYAYYIATLTRRKKAESIIDQHKNKLSVLRNKLSPMQQGV